MPSGNTNRDSLTLTEKSKLKHILGGTTWKPEPIWVLGHTAAVLSGKSNLVGGSEERVLSVSVYVWTGLDCKLSHRMAFHCYSSLQQHCSLKRVIPLNIDTVAESPLDKQPLSLPLSCSPSLSHGDAGTEPESSALLALIELQLQSAQQLAPRMWVRKSGTLQDSLVSGKGHHGDNR